MKPQKKFFIKSIAKNGNISKTYFFQYIIEGGANIVRIEKIVLLNSLDLPMYLAIGYEILKHFKTTFLVVQRFAIQLEVLKTAMCAFQEPYIIGE